MRISRYTGTTVGEALARVKAALGDEAVILETVEAGGIVTVTAAIDHAPLARAARGTDPALGDEVRQLIDVVRDLVAWPAHEERALVPELRQLQRALSGQGVDGVIAAALLRAVADHVADGRALESALVETLARGVEPPAAGRVQLFVGPPGDGKTTTIAKLAAGERRAGRRVALVTTDTYRVGAVTELTTYGRALRIPVHVASDAAELAQALADAAGAERVLVDTAGSGAADGAQPAELGALAAAAGPEATRTLVLSATTAARAAEDAWRAFSALRLDRCVVTKLDAAPGAPVLGLCWRHGLPVSHVADGRRIPDDIAAATPAHLARRLLAA